MNRIVAVGSFDDDGTDELPGETAGTERAESSSEPAESPSATAESTETSSATAEPAESTAIPEPKGASTAAFEPAKQPKSTAKWPPVRVDETPNPSELDLPDFRPRRRGRTAFALVGIAATVAVAGFAWSRFANRTEQPAPRAAAPAPKPAPERAPAPPTPAPAPAPAPSPVATAADETTTKPAGVESAAAGSLEKAPGAVTVTVKVVPEDAVIFRAGKRLGAGTVEVSVERNVKQRLTALLDGYTPSNIIVDGTRDSVTIILRRAPKPRPAPAPESTADAPSTDSTTTTPTATAAPTATTETAPPAPAPDSPSTPAP